MYWEVNKEIALLQSLRKYDNRTYNRNIAYLGKRAFNRMLHTDRHDDFFGWM